MKARTGVAELKVDESGQKYWEIHDSASKDAYALDTGKPLEFNPDAFNIGVSIEIFENQI